MDNLLYFKNNLSHGDDDYNGEVDDSEDNFYDADEYYD